MTHPDPNCPKCQGDGVIASANWSGFPRVECECVREKAEQEARLLNDRDWRTKLHHVKQERDEAIALLWIGWHEMNAIRARSGVPLDFDGRPQAIVEGYWDEAVDKMAEFLSRYDADKPWPPQRFTLEWSDHAKGKGGT